MPFAALPHPKCEGPDDHLSALSPRPRGTALAAYWQAHEAEGALVQRQGACFLGLVIVSLGGTGTQSEPPVRSGVIAWSP